MSGTSCRAATGAADRAGSVHQPWCELLPNRGGSCTSCNDPALLSSQVRGLCGRSRLPSKLATRVRFSASAPSAEEHGAGKGSIPCAETGRTAGLLLAPMSSAACGGVVLLGAMTATTPPARPMRAEHTDCMHRGRFAHRRVRPDRSDPDERAVAASGEASVGRPSRRRRRGAGQLARR